jgi:hypothetical protein
VAAFVDYALKAGRLEVAPGSAHWTQRPLIPSPEFFDVLRRRMAGAIRATSPLEPALEWAAERLADDSVLAAVHLRMAYVATNLTSFGAPKLPPIEFFMEREGGLKILQALIGRQDPVRARLLEVAVFSRTEVASECGVSRVHLNKLLEDAEAKGLLVRDGRARIVFDPALNDSYELWAALQVQATRLVAEATQRHKS